MLSTASCRWLLNSAQLTAHLAEHGIVLPSLTGVPVAASYRKNVLYDPGQALAYCEANTGEAAP